MVSTDALKVEISDEFRTKLNKIQATLGKDTTLEQLIDSLNNTNQLVVNVFKSRGVL